MVGRGDCHCSVNRGIYSIMIEAITQFYIGSISDEYTWFLPKEEISMPSRSITRSDQTSSTEAFLPISKLPKVPFSSSLYQIAKPLMSHMSSLILSLLLLMKMKTSPLIRSCGICFLTRPDRPLKPSERKRN